MCPSSYLEMCENIISIAKQVKSCWMHKIFKPCLYPQPFTVIDIP